MPNIRTLFRGRGRGLAFYVAAVAMGVSGTLIVQRVRAAGIPATGTLTYSGQLSLADGTVINGSKYIGLVVYDAASAGNRVCDVMSTQVVVDAGHFRIPLPDACVAAVKANADLWVDIQVEGASIGRSKFGAVPYAVEAAEASGAVGPLAQQVVPAGAVMAFDLAACPPGWTELELAKGRALIGVTTGLTRGTPVGANSVALSTGQMPVHSHTGTTGAGNAMTYRVVATTGTTVASNHVNGWTGTSAYLDAVDANWPLAQHTHGFTTDAAGSGQAFDNRQDSLPLLFCKKN